MSKRVARTGVREHNVKKRRRTEVEETESDSVSVLPSEIWIAICRTLLGSYLGLRAILDLDATCRWFHDSIKLQYVVIWRPLLSDVAFYSQANKRHVIKGSLADGKFVVCTLCDKLVNFYSSTWRTGFSLVGHFEQKTHRVLSDAQRQCQCSASRSCTKNIPPISSSVWRINGAGTMMRGIRTIFPLSPSPGRTKRKKRNTSKGELVFSGFVFSTKPTLKREAQKRFENKDFCSRSTLRAIRGVVLFVLCNTDLPSLGRR